MSRLSRVQINKSINDLIKQEFTTIPIQSSDTEEGFERPSFFVSIETNGMGTFQFNALREMTCRIKYFPSDRYIYKEEAYDVQDRLELIFGLNFNVGTRVITTSDADTDIIDKVVHFSFSFSFYDSVEQELTGEVMKELNYNG